MSLDQEIDAVSRKMRDAIREHEHFQLMMDSMSAPAKRIVEELLAGNVSPDLIRAVRECTPQEIRRYTFLRALEGGNPNPVVAVNLTNLVLGYLADGLDEFLEYEDDPDY